MTTEEHGAWVSACVWSLGPPPLAAPLSSRYSSWRPFQHQAHPGAQLVPVLYGYQESVPSHVPLRWPRRLGRSPDTASAYLIPALTV